MRHKHNRNNRQSQGDVPAAWAEAALASSNTLPSTHQTFESLDQLGAAQPGKLVVGLDTSPVAIEQYRRLAAVMHQAQANRGVRIAMVTSAFAAEGKSLTAANIALTLSESYRRRVLLIDADLRRPTLHDTFQFPNLAGVSDWLKEAGSGLGQLPSRVEITPHLDLLPGGRPSNDPMSGLTSERMRGLLAMASEKYDWVILDTPPTAFLPDGHLLASMVDAIVLVVVSGQTPAPAAQRAVEDLGRDKIIGVVLNRVQTAAMTAYGQSSYYTSYRTSSAATALSAAAEAKEPRV